MSPKYKVGDYLFYQDRWGTMFIHILSINMEKQQYYTLTIRDHLGDLEVPYPFDMIEEETHFRLATKAERILLCK